MDNVARPIQTSSSSIKNVHSVYCLALSVGTMAGTEWMSQRNGKWYLCSDGYPVWPLDVLYMLFPNHGRDSTATNVCFVPRHFKFPAVENLLPPRTEQFVPEDLVDSLIFLPLLCIVVTVAMVVTKAAWDYFDPVFAAVKPAHKKWYIVANLYKAFFLAVLATSHRFWVRNYLAFILDEFNCLPVKRCAMVYVVTDVVALYMVPKLPRSTILHHVVTTTLCVIVCATDLTVDGWGGLLGICKMTLLYGTFSTIAFPVNAYLALRVVYSNAKWMTALIKLSLWTYVLCCAINWSAHAFWLFRISVTFELSIYALLYILAVSVIINDDIVLIKWLIKRSSPMASTNDLKGNIDIPLLQRTPDENDKKEQ